MAYLLELAYTLKSVDADALLSPDPITGSTVF